MRTTRFGHRPLAIALVAVVTAGLAACTGSDEQTPQEKAAAAFLDAVGDRNTAKAAAATSEPTAARTTVAASLSGLGTGARGSFDLGKTSGNSVAYTATWTLAPGATWKYTGSVPLAKKGSGWTVRWAPSALHPKLGAGQHLATERVQPTRAALQDDTGAALVKPTPVVTVGLEKSKVTDAAKLASTLAGVSELDSTRAELLASLRKAAPTEFVPVITLRRPVYESIKAKIYNLPGTVFRSETRQLGPTATFAQPLLGRVTDATAEIVAKSKGRIAAGDTTGVGGLQQGLDSQLAGAAGLRVVAADDTAATPATLATVRAPKPGTPVRLTLDSSVQRAAESALDGVGEKAALVVVQPSTGKILADANTAATTYDFGLAGAFPPGSTFKIATWTAAFTARPSLTPESTVRCPATVTVDGRRFENENRFSHPPISISDAFGYSCNTSAIDVARQLPTSAIGSAAKLLGLGRTWTLPVDAYSGSVPAPATETERAADAIGQGRVLASPLLMALMAGSASTGKVISPTLTADAEPTSASDVPAGIVAKMRTLMAAPVQLGGGTARALRGLGGVIGKTGTAEYGNANPPRSHSWFAGVRGDLAFAVFVYDGDSSGTTGVPIAKRLLTRLR